MKGKSKKSVGGHRAQQPEKFSYQQVVEMLKDRNDDLLTSAEAAKLLKISPRNLARLRKRKELPSAKIGNTRYYSKNYIQAVFFHRIVNSFKKL